MTKTETATRPRGDSVDRLIDDVLREPSRAEDVKRALRRRMAEPTPARSPAMAHLRPGPDGDEDDLWENLPI